MDYSKTLNLPRTDFPMRARLPEKEPEILKFWDDIDIYSRVQKAKNLKPKFILHDGPPYANGNIHLGTTLNKVLKDMVVKYYSMAGYDAPFVPGWDTHGLPIEQQAIKNWKLDRHDSDPVHFRQKCKEYALKFVNIQKKEFKRLGVRADWEHPYLTLSPDFEATQIEIFGKMAQKGYIYRGLKPVYWCTDCETALAEAEVEYGDRESPSIYVKFPVFNSYGLFEKENSYIVIWTTTPWTLPANVAISLHPEQKYVLVRTGGEKLLMAERRYREVLEECALQGEVLQSFEGRQLDGVACINPLMERESKIVFGEHVTMDQGTGCVHTAPGHGLEDYEVGKRYDLPVISPLDDHGCFTSEGKQFQGLFYKKANQKIIEELEKKGFLLNQELIQHQYPHCWRCKNPVIFRATEQWFASIDGFRKQALEAIKRVRWIPSWGEERIYKMVADRSDWCISRQRLWGVPIPIFYCTTCRQTIIDDETINNIQKLFRKYGSDVWYLRKAEELLPEGYTCSKCGGNYFEKEKDIMDVWFDSGSSHLAVLEDRPELRWPADLYLEGSDQHRGWFNSSLATSIAVRGEPPYRTVLTHGYVVDEQGRKMSKSLGNGIDPMEEVQRLGADILRLWVASSDYKRDVAASPNIMKQVTDAYRKIRNTCRFLLANLYDYDHEKDIVIFRELTELDRWALLRLQRLVQRTTKAFESYEFHQAYRAIYNFCVVEMSSFYLDIIKDRLYTSRSDSPGRRAAQTVLYKVLDSLVRLLAPVLAFTSEEIWQHMNRPGDSPVSVQLASWPVVEKQYLNDDLEQKWERVFEIREEVIKFLEEARQKKIIGSSLEASLHLYPDENLYNFLVDLEDQLSTLIITSGVTLHRPDEEAPEDAQVARNMNLKVVVCRAQGKKCERCWTYNSDVGENKEHPTLCCRCAGVVNGMTVPESTKQLSRES